MKQLFFPLAFISVILLSTSCNKMTPNPGSSDSTHIVLDTTGTDTVNLNAGLLLYLPFNGSIADSSGNGNTVTSLGSVALAVDEHGYTNSALEGAANGVLLVNNNGSIRFDTAFTISFHFMCKNPGLEQVFISMINYTTGHGPCFQVGLGTSADSVAYYDYLTAGFMDTTVACDGWGTGHGHGAVTSWKPVQYAWYQYTGIFSKGKTSVYINGQLIYTDINTTYTRANFCPSDNVVIGGWWSTDPQSFDGKLDDVRLYNRVLNAKEIAKLASAFQQNTKAGAAQQSGHSGSLQ